MLEGIRNSLSGIRAWHNARNSVSIYALYAANGFTPPLVADLFPGISAARVWVFADGGSTVMVSHA